ncbi:MAG: nucleotidyltransferase domain-containing protein [Patescibacteria group bacterium]
MNEFLSMEDKKKQEIIKEIKEILLKKERVIFSFIFGSFLGSSSFRDIDIGIYIKNINENEVLDYELKISKEIADKCGLSFDIFDVKVLNFAPNSFLNNIFNKGKLIFSNDYKLLTDLIEDTSFDAISNEYIALQSLKELVPA